MNELTRQADHLFGPLTAAIAGCTRRGGADPGRRDAICHRLQVVRSLIDEAIGSCVRRESQ